MTSKTLPVWTLICVVLFSTGPSMAASDTETRIEKPVRQSIQTRQATQSAEADWREEKERLTTKYEQLQKDQAQLTRQKNELTEKTDTTRSRISIKEKQLADIQQISSQIEPFLKEMLAVLKTEVASGYPFLPDERNKRIANLEHLMVDPDVSISEKYRKVMEAFLVEAEYGFTIETYQATIDIAGQSMLVDIFRLGRISLFYQSLDRSQCGFYNVADTAWQPLPAVHNTAIHAAIDMAAKRKPVELLTLPVGRVVPR